MRQWLAERTDDLGRTNFWFSSIVRIHLSDHASMGRLNAGR